MSIISFMQKEFALMNANLILNREERVNRLYEIEKECAEHRQNLYNYMEKKNRTVSWYNELREFSPDLPELSEYSRMSDKDAMNVLERLRKLSKLKNIMNQEEDKNVTSVEDIHVDTDNVYPPDPD